MRRPGEAPSVQGVEATGVVEVAKESIVKLDVAENQSTTAEAPSPAPEKDNGSNLKPERGNELTRMVATAFANRDEITKVYLDARDWLKPTEVGEVGHRLNVGESLLHELTRATLSAKLQRTEWEIENTIAFGAMRLDATERLMSERATQTKAKAITEKDVEAKCLALYPDAYKQQEMERERVQRTTELLDATLDHVASRIKTLQGMMAKGR